MRRSMLPRPRARHAVDDSDAGFTLLEVIVALAILGISLAILFAIFSQGIARTHSNADEAAARMLAQSLLARSLHAELPAATGVSPDGIAWRIARSPFGSADERTNWSHRLERVTVMVAWREGLVSRKLALTTLQLQPKQPQP